MEFVYFSNEFPNEDLQNLFRNLQIQNLDREHNSLAVFLHEATLALKDEIRQLPIDLRQQIPPFESVFAWAEDKQLREGPLCGAIDGVLLIMAQLASYIGYMEMNGISLHLAPGKALAGLGVGLLSSTAVALAPTLGDLPRAAVDAVRLAFRMGIHVQGVSENLEARDEPPQTWAYVVNNVDSKAVQQELDTLQSSQQASPETGKIFVSAVSGKSVTISGPPSRLKSLFNTCEFFRDAQSIALPVYGGLCHAPHVYTQDDTASIVDGSRLNTVSSGAIPVMPLYSTSTGKPYAAENAVELYHSVVSELLTQAINWEGVVANITEKATQEQPSDITLSFFGNSLPLKELKTSLDGTLGSGLECSLNLLTSWVTRVKPHAGPRNTAQAKLAIVGMSCRLPGGATSNAKFWEVLEQGLDVSREIPEDRFDLATHYDPDGKDMNKSATRYGCFIDEPGLFDAPFFNMSPKEAQTVDPQMRLALVTAYEALEQSGYSPGRISTESERVGTFYGQAADDYREVNQGQEVSTYYIPGGCRAFGPGRINYFFKFSGPSYSIDTACSSGLAAVEVACQALWSGSVDTAITGGVNVLTNPDGFSGLAHGHFLTKGHNACKTWDAEADGYCRADGVVSFVIKRLEDAVANNDTVLATILGAGTNHSAQAVSITHPHAGHQAYLARQVLRQTGVDPLNVSYVELHGTGTQAGDFEEMSGIHEVYAPLKGKRRSKDQPLHIGSAKANVGHGESVAGATSLLKVLLMLRENKIPPHVGIKTTINPRLDYNSFEKRNLHIDFELADWPKIPGKQRLAVVNSFGAAGGNTTMVLEEAADREILEPDTRGNPIIAVSAKTKKSLTQNIENLIDYLEAHPDTNIADLGYTTTARRYHHNHRIAFATTDVENTKKQLKSRIDKVDDLKSIASVSSNPPPIAFAFTGQGASHKSMSLELYRDSPSFRRSIDDLDTLAQGQGFPSFIPALDGSCDKDYEHAPVVTQLALACSEIALARLWQTLGIKPDVVIGHSLGEYAALHIAGVLSASDAVFMVGRRAQMLQEKCEIRSHTMMAVRATQADIEAKAEGKPYTIACVNGPSDTVLSGTKQQMDDVAEPLEKAGFRCFKLDVAFAFHSEQVDPILDEYEAVLEAGILFQEPKLPVISPLLGKVVFDDKTLNANYFRRATRESVDFLAALQHAEKISTVGEDTVFIEIGPHPTCINFIKSCLSSTSLAVPSIKRGEDNWKTLAESLSSLHLLGLSLRWDEFHRPFERKLQVISDLPSYAFNEKNHWLPYTGTWCLTKGNDFYGVEDNNGSAIMPPAINDLQTSTVQRIIEESFDGSAATVVMRSDLMQPDFLAAANGHRMNDCGVVTSSIHADIAYTLGEHLYNTINPKNKTLPPMNMTNLVVTKGLVANNSPQTPQVIQVTAQTSDYKNGVDLVWHNIDTAGNAEEESFATAKLIFGNSSEWLSSWVPYQHLINTRVEALDRMAAEGKASRFSHKMAYGLFASNLVDYAEKYRGMQSVVMNDLEGFADIQLTHKESGTWTVPPYFIDSVAHLAGFIMNCSDAMDVRNNFCVTPGWESMRFAKPLGPPGAKYRSYVKMIPTEEDPSIYKGDVYIMQNEVIVGFVGGITFRKYPRALINRFFSPPEKNAAPSGESKKKAAAPKPKAAAPKKNEQAAPKPEQTQAEKKPAEDKAAKAEKDTASSRSSDSSDDESVSTAPSTPPESEAPGTPKPEKQESAAADNDSISSRAFQLIADECGCERAEMEDDMSFADLGVDSLMSLVVSEKLRTLDVTVSGSLFLEYPTIGDLRTWLDEAYG